MPATLMRAATRLTLAPHIQQRILYTVTSSVVPPPRVYAFDKSCPAPGSSQQESWAATAQYS